MADVIVKRDGQTWGIYINGKLVEGGFFSKHAAEHAAREWEANTRNS